jgi:YesN/AraC family two-component response regulator
VLKRDKDHFKQDEIKVIASSALKPTIEVPVIDTVLAPHQTDIDEKESELVLLVEDNPELSEFLAKQLKSSYRVALAYDGLQGFEKATKLLPDLIVSDIMMPNMDGITMLDQLKNSTLTSHIPVVLLSARYDINSQIEGLRYGADYYITKPFNTDFLKASIHNLLEQRKKIFNKLQEGEMVEQKPTGIVITSQDEDFLKTVIQFVEEGMQESEFEIEEIATSVNMSRSAFYKKFKSLTNMAPVEFVNEMRLKRAKQLLDAGALNISSVSFEVGFSSPKYFSTSFRKYYHCSPSEYLKKVKDHVK